VIVPCCRGCSVRSVSVIRIRLGANVGMSEAKRVPLQTLEFPESLGHATKKEKKGNMGKQLAPSFRFTLTLPESNEKTCPEFNYSQLLKSAEVSFSWREGSRCRDEYDENERPYVKRVTRETSGYQEREKERNRGGREREGKNARVRRWNASRMTTAVERA